MRSRPRACPPNPISSTPAAGNSSPTAATSSDCSWISPRHRTSPCYGKSPLRAAARVRPDRGPGPRPVAAAGGGTRDWTRTDASVARRFARLTAAVSAAVPHYHPPFAVARTSPSLNRTRNSIPGRTAAASVNGAPAASETNAYPRASTASYETGVQPRRHALQPCPRLPQPCPQRRIVQPRQYPRGGRGAPGDRVPATPSATARPPAPASPAAR